MQDGCRNRCSYCIVTLARGDERSRTVREVVAEVRALERAGYREAVLTGVHLGAYGRDRDETLAALVRALCDETTMPRLRLSSLEPFDLHPEFFRLWEASEGRLMPHLHLPAQSGSDSVLRRMARRNTVAEFEGLAAAARASIPGLTLTTDLIAGFPGETEGEFERTVEFARRMRFAHIHAFSFSSRPGTAAARMGGQLPGMTRAGRAARLGAVSQEMGEEVRRGFLGTVRPVLWESCEPDPDEPAATLWSGLTDNYLRVLARVPGDLDLHNKTLPVRLVRAEGEHMWAEWASPLEGA